MPRFDQSFTGLCEQNLQDTQLLKQRFLDAKVKRPPKAKEKAAKQQEAANAAASGSIQSSVHVQQKFLKRPAEDHDPGGSDQQTGENFEPPVKLQCTAQQHNSHQNDQGLTKFSVEIVQQLEFTTSAANSQPQQISTNVTVKTHANASVKSDVSSPKSNPSTPASGVAGMHQKSNIGLETLVECVKQEPDNDFADLDQCAAALEKDAAANGGAGFGGFSDLIGDDTNDEIISSATFNDLISDISNYPDYELMKDFDFEDKSESNSNIMKVEDNKDLLQNVDNTNKTTHSPLLQNQNNYSPPVFENQTIKNRLPGYSNMDFTKTELSPAAQTLKHMAEQHQHQKQMGLSFNPSTRTPNSRSPYPDFQFQGDYGSPNSNSNFHKNSPTFPQPDMIKQEMIFQGNEFDIKRKTSSAAAAAAANMYNPQQQQYSPYGSPGGGHGSPGYLPRGAAPPGQGQFGGGTPPRPPSGPGQGNSNSNGPSVQINQAQQLNVSQQGHGHSIQVSAGQHVHLSGDLKGNVSIAAQQGMHFQHNSNSNQPQGTNNGNHHTHNQQSSPMSAPQHQGSPMGGGMGGQMGGMMPNAQQMGQQQQGMQSGLSGSNGGLGSNINMGGPLGSMAGPNNGLGSNGMGPNSGMGPSGGMGGPGGIPSGMGNMHPGMQHVGGMGHQNDSYSLSQTQTINFTQQSLRRASGPGVPNMGGNGPGSNLPSMPGQQQGGGMGGPRLLSAQSLEQQQQQQKLLHQQQQMLRAQQQYMAATRPPPPDYKASAAGMIQSGMQPRYAGAPGGPPPVMRRVGGGHQPMPPSGPMIRSNMYMLQQQQQHQQQQMPQRASLYSRQQGPMGVGIESVQQHSQAEWRHLLMTQQQNGGFNTMRPNFQQGFNLNSGSMHQMTALQHQQIRMSVHQQQQGMGGQPQPQSMNNQNQLMVQGGGGGPMAQMNNMNQAVLHMQQQQQQQQQQHSLVQQQQQNSHMSLSSIHMQQSQSISVTNQSIQQQNHLAEQLGNATSNNQNNALSNFNPQADFNFEFLDNLGAGDSTAFTDQELLNSFDSDAGFNLDF